MSYVYPTSTTRIADEDGTFAGHVARKSVNPGTDYAAPYGSVVVAVAAGVVTQVTTTFGGSGGRMVHVDHDDGTGADYLHLSAISVRVGQRVAQGEQLGLSGASGNGSEWGYGAHLHISFRPVHGSAYMNVRNLDFDALMRNTTTAANTAHALAPTQGDDDVAAAVIIKNNDTTDKSLYLVPDDGDLVVLHSMDEVEALVMSGAVRLGPKGEHYIQAPDGMLIRMRMQVAARKRQQFAQTRG